MAQKPKTVRAIHANQKAHISPPIATIAAAQGDGLSGVQHSLGDGALPAVQGNAQTMIELPEFFTRQQTILGSS